MQVFINNSARFCLLYIWTVSSQTFLEECKYEKEKIKTKNYIDENLKTDSDSNDETEPDTDTDMDINDNK